MAKSSQTVTVDANVAPFTSSLDAAAKALDAFVSGPVTSASQTIEKSIGGSFKTVETTIVEAMLSGQESVRQLTNTILEEFNAVSEREFIVRPIEGLLNSVVGSLLGGGRAAGGPVAAGTPYLVGEDGPEIFTPAGAGSITPNASLGSPRSTVVVNIQAKDAQSILKSQSQIAAMLSRALAKGQRNL